MENSLKTVLIFNPPQTLKWIDRHTFTKSVDAFLQMFSGRYVAGVFYGHYLSL